VTNARRRLLLLLAATLGAAGVLPAQTKPGPEALRGVKSKSDLDAIVAKLRSGELKGPQALFEAEPQGPYRVYTSYINARKGLADIHPTDDEIFVILSGSAECTLGGDIPDKKLEGRDYHGPAVVGGVTRSVAAGDIVSAPRGTAHQMDPGAGHVLYVVIKILGS
jgi:mannose-6-phosphate isomerase-like protein (cupin superfamily)